MWKIYAIYHWTLHESEQFLVKGHISSKTCQTYNFRIESGKSKIYIQ